MVRLYKNDTSVILEVSWIGSDEVWFARKTCTAHTNQKEAISEEFNYAYERIYNALSMGEPFVEIKISCL